MAPELDLQGPVVLFDGVCNLCTASVRFLLSHEADGRLRFASLQSPAGRALAEAVGLPAMTGGPSDSVAVVEDGIGYVRSVAALRLASHLRSPYRQLGAVLRFVPRPLRDALYRFVAEHRYRWFGKTSEDACWVPTPALRGRFLG